MLEHLEGNLIKLRGHHLLGGVVLTIPEGFRDRLQSGILVNLNERGYGTKFGKRTVQFWNELSQKPDLNIELIDNLDYFCLDLGCPKKREACSSLEYSNYDIDTIVNLGLMPYSVYSVGQIRDALKRKIESKNSGLKL